MPRKQDDIGVRAHVLRHRIYNLEQKHAQTGYPDKRKELADEIDGLVEEYEALVPEIEAEAAKQRQEIRDELEALMVKRDRFLRLIGRREDDTAHRNAVGETWLPHGPRPWFGKALELDIAELEHYPETVWDQRTRNEQIGKGYVTDAHADGNKLSRMGAGASITKFPNIGNDR